MKTEVSGEARPKLEDQDRRRAAERIAAVSCRLTFVDAAALTAVLAPTTPEHRLVGQQWQFELDGATTLVTTDFALTRASVWLQRSHGVAGLRALHEMAAPALHVEWCTSADYDRAVAALLASGGRGADLVDALDEQVRRKLKIRHDLRW